MTERWRPVVGWEGLYDVSDQGRVRSLRRTVIRQCENGPVAQSVPERVLRPSVTARRAYPVVRLMDNGRDEYRTVHSLVLAAFVGPRSGGHQICHDNGDPADNRLVNLRYGTGRDNYRDKVRHGKGHARGGNPRAKLTEEAVRRIRQDATAPLTELAARFGVSQGAIWFVRKNLTWVD